MEKLTHLIGSFYIVVGRIDESETFNVGGTFTRRDTHQCILRLGILPFDIVDVVCC